MAGKKIPEVTLDDVFLNIECGHYSDMSCLCDDDVRTQLLSWIEKWGVSGVQRIARRMCMCAVAQPPPAPKPVLNPATPGPQTIPVTYTEPGDTCSTGIPPSGKRK